MKFVLHNFAHESKVTEFFNQKGYVTEKIYDNVMEHATEMLNAGFNIMILHVKGSEDFSYVLFVDTKGFQQR